MARLENDVSLVPSILDRLLDDRPGVSQEPIPDRFQHLADLKRSVTRDLQALLNTRQERGIASRRDADPFAVPEALKELPAEFSELGRSILAYGLPDFTALSLRNDRDRGRMQRAVEQAIARFEPRLDGVRVHVEAPRQHDQMLRFRIEAMLRVKPAPEPITFDAVLQLDTQAYVVRGPE